ncbi:hypothetical protein IMSHALPRED_002081 [Imshaugia aleurites]|uniref:Uncharacterized protein n=1 Tax=Imshaugia aleurites TaxID=172621 RepID=A0A8H3J4L7_9LECA|nr:hypothetical protein IMSHALPRED_002081 [Imshaugia aleurites]
MAGIQNIDIGSLDPEYIAVCIRCAQRHGVHHARPTIVHGNTQHQVSNPFADNTPFPARVQKHPSRKAKTRLPKRTPQSHHPSPTRNQQNKDLAIRYNYDPLWVQNTGADPSSVLKFCSKLCFEDLFVHGVIQKGDRLEIGYSAAFSTKAKQGIATLTYIGLSSISIENRRQRPDLILTLSSHASARTIRACSGPENILAVFADCDIRGPEIVQRLATNLHVWRGNVELGTFMFVRQAYDTWMMEKDAEAERTGTEWRRRIAHLKKVHERKRKLTTRESDAEDE